MNVIIGVDPHKATHHVVAVSDDEDELAQVSVRACRTQTARRVSWAEPFPSRTWAVEGADGLCHLLSQQLVAAGERRASVHDLVLSGGRVTQGPPWPTQLSPPPPPPSMTIPVGEEFDEQDEMWGAA